MDRTTSSDGHSSPPRKNPARSPKTKVIARRLQYQPRVDLVINYTTGWPYLPHKLPFWSRIRVYDGGPDRPTIVVAQNIARCGDGNLAVVADGLRCSPFVSLVVDPDTTLWFNHSTGPLGGYSRRSERIDLVDFDAPRVGKLGDELASTRMTRGQVEARFGLEFPEGVILVEDDRDAPRVFHDWRRRVLDASRD